ncbi:MAG: ATP-binding protein [Acidobacteriia bacterium]|nr:ATP-binding protein [Terriglobia bacterium]
MTKRLSGTQKQQILEMLKLGASRHVIADKLGVTPGQVSAVAAHLTMGTYTRPPEPAPGAGSSQFSPASREAKAPGLPPSIPPASGIFVGLDTSDETPVYWNPASEEGSANPHVLILGESGYGKTYATSCLLAELANSNVPSVIFDYGQGFSPETLDPVFRDQARPVHFELSRDGIAINPLEIFPVDIHGPATVAQRIADTFARVYPRIGVQQHAAIRRAVLEVLADSGIKQHDRATWGARPPHFRNVERKLADLAEQPASPVRRVALAAASHISTLFVFDTFRSTGRKLSWNDLIGPQEAHTWILQLGGLESSVERTVTEFLLWNLIRFVEARGPGKLRCFVVLDEAHKMSFSPGSPVEKLLREGRKFGLGLILASQQPEDFSPVAFANTATKIVFQVSDERGVISRKLSRKTKNREIGLAAADVITKLPRGSAYVVTENAGRIVTISSFEQRLARWSRPELRQFALSRTKEAQEDA